MPDGRLRPDKAYVAFLLILSGNGLFVRCQNGSENATIHCSIAAAEFVAANAIRIWWNVTGLSSWMEDHSSCQIRITNDTSCEIPLQEYTAAITNSTSAYNNRHTFWLDHERPAELLGYYMICTRIAMRRRGSRNNTSISSWNTKTLQMIVQMPPIIKSCSVQIGHDVNKIYRFEKREIFIFGKGDDVKFACDVGGIPVPRIKWCKDTRYCNRSIAEEDASDLTLKHADKAIEGVYVAVVENEFGRAISTGMYIRQSELGNFDRDSRPSSLTFKEGDSMFLPCKAPISIPAPVVQWVKTSRHTKTTITPDERVVLGVDGSLIILDTAVSDSGNYSCKCFNVLLDESHESRDTSVEVEGHETFNVQPSIQNKNPSNEETVLGLVGETVKLQCVFSGRPRPRILWYKDSTLLQPSSSSADSRINKTFDGYTLVINSLVKSDEGSYKCQAENSEGMSQFYIKVIVHEPATLVIGLLSKKVTVGEDSEFRCQAEGMPPPTTEWMINGRIVTDDLLNLWNARISSDESQMTFHNVTLNRTCVIQCNITNDYGYALSSAYLKVFSATTITQISTVRIDRDRGFAIVDCIAETDPQTPLYFNWSREEVSMSTHDNIYTQLKNGSLLVNFSQPKDDDVDFTDNYTCEAFNGLSIDTVTIHVTGVSKETHEPWPVKFKIGLLGGIVFVALLILLIGSTCVVLTFLRKRKRRPFHASYSPPSGSCSPHISYSSRPESRSADSSECLVCESGWCNGLMPLNDRLKEAIRQMYIPRDRLQLKEIIGKGQFGRVYAALLRDPRDITEQVAVKTMKYKPDESEMVELFLKEAVIMKDFRHLNVLGIRGITFDADNSPMVILPYMAKGDLRKYILNPELDITVLNLLNMGLQVARGMQYLSQMRFVHRDLAARNCMVNERGIVKVADFGLSRELIVRDYYRVESSGTTPVPVRWMAPECLEANLFTTMSDVWSFGVLLWELMTRGAVPYPDVENWQIASHVQNGKRLEQPLFCPDVVYEIMKSCWEVEQRDRPSFEDLVESIENVILSAKPGARGNPFLYQNIAQDSAASSEVAKECKTMDYRDR